MAADPKNGIGYFDNSCLSFICVQYNNGKLLCFYTKHSEARGASIKHLIALFSCREVLLPRSIWVKARSSDRFWENLINGVFSDDVWGEKFRMGRIEFQNLANES